jgi:hypothetical protein
MADKKKFKFSYGEKVKLKDLNGIYEVIGMSYNYEILDGESAEMITYDIKHTKTKTITFALMEDEIEKLSLVENKTETGTLGKPKKLTNKEIDYLLDLYNDYRSLDELYHSLQMKDVDVQNNYIKLSNDVLDYLHESVNMK